MNVITKSVNIQLDSLLVRLNVCSIDGSTGPIIPVSSDPMKTPIKKSIKIKFRVFVSNVFVVIVHHRFVKLLVSCLIIVNIFFKGFNYIVFKYNAFFRESL